MTQQNFGFRGPALEIRVALGRRLGPCAVAIVGLFVSPLPASAQQRWWVSTGVSVRGEATNNVNFATGGQEQSDVMLQVSPSISFNGQGGGGRLRASGNFELGSGLVTHTSQSNPTTLSLQPQGNLNATLEAIENFFFIDGSLSVQRSIENPFLARPNTFSDYNTSTTYQASLSPYIKGDLGNGFNYVVRSDNSWTDSSTTTGQYTGNHTAILQRSPQPLGGSLSAVHSETSSPLSDQPGLRSDLVRANLRYAFTPELVLGLRGGTERNNYELQNQWKTFHGADLTWQPTERTKLDGFWEDRFFGSSWQASLTHRMPRLALNLNWSRSLATTSQQYLTFPGLANLISLLDASLITRVPDPVARQQIILSFLASQQLPPELLTPVVIFDDRISLQTVGSASAVLTGIRNSLAFSIYQTTTIGLAGVNTQLPPTLANNRQRGAELTYSHNVTSADTLSATGTWTRTENLPGQTPLETTQKQVRLQVSSKLGAYTNGYVGGRYQWIDSNVTNDAREAAIFAGFDYRFF